LESISSRPFASNPGPGRPRKSAGCRALSLEIGSFADEALRDPLPSSALTGFSVGVPEHPAEGDTSSGASTLLAIIARLEALREEGRSDTPPQPVRQHPFARMTLASRMAKTQLIVRQTTFASRLAHTQRVMRGAQGWLRAPADVHARREPCDWTRPRSRAPRRQTSSRRRASRSPARQRDDAEPLLDLRGRC
jgi:hypothetical protein